MLRVEEHLATRDAVAQTRGEGFNPLALTSLLTGFALRGRLDVPTRELFEAAGLRFAMGSDILNEIIPAVMERIQALDVPGLAADAAS